MSASTSKRKRCIELSVPWLLMRLTELHLTMTATPARTTPIYGEALTISTKPAKSRISRGPKSLHKRGVPFNMNRSYINTLYNSKSGSSWFSSCAYAFTVRHFGTKQNFLNIIKPTHETHAHGMNTDVHAHEMHACVLGVTGMCFTAAYLMDGTSQACIS
jgi:hypothetical protein